MEFYSINDCLSGFNLKQQWQHCEGDKELQDTELQFKRKNKFYSKKNKLRPPIDNIR